jgi:predicted dehydrogenase
VLVRMHRWEPAAPHAASESPALPEPLVRDLDLALWLLGKPTDRVYAVEQRAGDLPCGRFLQVHLGCAGGGMALVDYADALPPGAGYQSLSVIGTAGAAYADDHSNMQLVYDGGHPRAVRTDEGTTYVAAMVQAFVAQLDAGGDPPGSVTSWQTVWGLADAVSRSLETGQAIAPGGI